MAYGSWLAYGAPGGGGAVPGLQNAPVRTGDQHVRPELADLARLGRRAVRGVVRAARADLTPTLSRRLTAHLGSLPQETAVVEESWRPYDHVNVQAGLEAWLADPEREHEIVGIAGFQHREFGLADVLGGDGGHDEPWGPRPGNVATVNLASGPDGEVRPCVACALYLVTEGGRRTALLLRGADENGPHEAVTLQAISTESGGAADATTAIRARALEHNVYRGQVVSFGTEIFHRRGALLQIHRRPSLDRSALVLPDGVLDSIERQVVGVGRHRDRLRASRQHLKRGLLLYGPPGTGKTHTVRYLVATAPGVTVVELSGGALHLISEACSVARTLAPSIVVVEDVDLIAEERSRHRGDHPLLFQLLNEMDGLDEDADVAFVLTTNRADLLEPALAARPGRVDQAIELGLPDARARRALLGLYRGGLELTGVDLDRIAERTAGVTASFLKELLRRAAVLAAEDPAEVPGDTGLTVSGEHLEAALAELEATENAMTRVLLGAGPPTLHIQA